MENKERAKKLIKQWTKENLTQAFGLLYATLKSTPSDAELYFLLGKIIDDNEADEERLIATDELLDLAPDLKAQDMDQLKLWQKSLAIDPNYHPCWFSLGKLHEVRDETAEAINCFTQVTNFDPNHLEAWCHLGNMLHFLATKGEKYEDTKISEPELAKKAIHALETAVKIDQTRAATLEAQFWLAELALLFKDQKKAIFWFSEQVKFTNDKHSRDMIRKLSDK
jgi:tetratricopeptide (TPR) repeat protein